MKTLQEQYDKVNEAGKGSKVYDKFENSVKTLAYGFEEYPELSALFKKADTLMNAIQKNKKKIIDTIGE